MKKWLKYQVALLNRAKSDTHRFMEIRKERILTSILSAFLGGIAYYYLAGASKLWEQIITILAFSVIGFIGTYVVEFTWNFIAAPVRVYEDLGGFSDVPVLLTSASDSSKEQTNVEVWVSLKVENMINLDITDCYLRLVDAIDLDSKSSVLRTSEYLTWSSREHYDGQENSRKMVKAKDFRVCDVAQTDSRNNRAIFTLWFGYPQPVQIGRYILTVCVFGNCKGKPFKGTRRFQLIYSGGFDMQLLNAENPRAAEHSVHPTGGIRPAKKS
jgi:hypothetical protein